MIKKLRIRQQPAWTGDRPEVCGNKWVSSMWMFDGVWTDLVVVRLPVWTKRYSCGVEAAQKPPGLCADLPNKIPITWWTRVMGIGSLCNSWWVMEVHQPVMASTTKIRCMLVVFSEWERKSLLRSKKRWCFYNAAKDSGVNLLVGFSCRKHHQYHRGIDNFERVKRICDIQLLKFDAHEITWENALSITTGRILSADRIKVKCQHRA